MSTQNPEILRVLQLIAENDSPALVYALMKRAAEERMLRHPLYYNFQARCNHTTFNVVDFDASDSWHVCADTLALEHQGCELDARHFPNLIHLQHLINVGDLVEPELLGSGTTEYSQCGSSWWLFEGGEGLLRVLCYLMDHEKVHLNGVQPPPSEHDGALRTTVDPARFVMNDYGMILVCQSWEAEV